MAVLAVLRSDGSIGTHAVGSPRYAIGRGMDNDLVIQSPFVSRRHAVLLSSPAGHAIQDLGSKNGTWVNGIRLGRAPLELTHQDLIVLGNTQVSLRFHATDETVTAAQVDGCPLGVSVDLAGREVLVQGKRLAPPLTRKEFDILARLWERRGQACSRDDLAARGWAERPPGDVSDAEIDQYIRRLRHRLGDTGGNHRLILTLRGYGYKIP